MSQLQILSKLSCKRAIKSKLYSLRFLDNRTMYSSGVHNTIRLANKGDRQELRNRLIQSSVAIAFFCLAYCLLLMGKLSISSPRSDSGVTLDAAVILLVFLGE